MNLRSTIAIVCTAFCLVSAMAQTPTWHQGVSCIIYTHCTPCHHEGGAGHFSLASHGEAYTWRNDIAAFTQAGLMPPWPPDPAYRSLAHERVLTQEEIDLLAAWVLAGAPEGDAAGALVPPLYDNGHVIVDPDITAIMPEYAIPPSSSDLYRCFVLDIDNAVDRHIKGLEVVPGNREVVHHVLVFQDTSGQARALDEAAIGPGYTSFGGIGVPSAKLVGIWVPGSEPYFSPPGMGIKLLAGADLVIQVHYPAGSGDRLDSTRVNIRLSDEPLIRDLAIDPILDHLITITNGPLAIPPNQVRTFKAEFTTPIPATITAIGPHAHLVCTSMRAYAVRPDGDTIPLIDIPQWDFRWQDLYSFRQPIFLPTGTKLHGEATYDNTAANANNPNSPPQWVFLGEATTDEMMLFYFAWTWGFPSDASIVVDTATHAAHYNGCDPGVMLSTGPEMEAAGFRAWYVELTGALSLSAPGAGQLFLRDAAGRLARTIRMQAGMHSMDVSGLARGVYVAEWHPQHGMAQERMKVLLR